MNNALVATLISISLLLFLVLIPLIPSVIIYRLFPNTTVATQGPLAGLTLKSSGAFSIYIIVFGVIAPFAYRTYNTITDLSHPSWTITGKLILKDDNGHAIVDPRTVNSVRVSLRPDIIQTDGTTFLVKVPEIDNRLPKLTFSVGDLGSEVLDVDDPGDYQLDRDDENKTIHMRSPITVRLMRAGTYNTATPPLAPTPTPAAVTAGGNP